eukprot:scaffold7662_cov77-Skeletonema_dohrnii-CCMP3373.AAC.3
MAAVETDSGVRAAQSESQRRTWRWLTASELDMAMGMVAWMVVNDRELELVGLGADVAHGIVVEGGGWRTGEDGAWRCRRIGAGQGRAGARHGVRAGSLSGSSGEG